MMSKNEVKIPVGPIRLFLRPLVFMWILSYLHQDFGVPAFGYWKCFWFFVGVGLFAGLFKRRDPENDFLIIKLRDPKISNSFAKNTNKKD